MSPRRSGKPYSSDRGGEITETIFPGFGPPHHRAKSLLQRPPRGPPGGPPVVTPDVSGIPCIARSENVNISAVPIPAGVVRVNSDGSSTLFLADTPGVGVIPGGFDPFMMAEEDDNAGTGATADGVETSEGEGSETTVPALSEAGLTTDAESTKEVSSEGYEEGSEGEGENSVPGLGLIVGFALAGAAVVALACIMLFVLHRHRSNLAARGANASKQPEKPHVVEYKPTSLIPPPGSGRQGPPVAMHAPASGRYAQVLHNDPVSMGSTVYTGHMLPAHVHPQSLPVVPVGLPMHAHHAYSATPPQRDRPPTRHAYIHQAPQSERQVRPGAVTHYPTGYPGSGYTPQAIAPRSMNGGTNTYSNLVNPYIKAENVAGGVMNSLQGVGSGAMTLEATSEHNSANSNTGRSLHHYVRLGCHLLALPLYACACSLLQFRTSFWRTQMCKKLLLAFCASFFPLGSPAVYVERKYIPRVLLKCCCSFLGFW